MSQNKPEYKKLSHVTYNCRYHVVWITKYRFRVIDDEIRTALKWSIKHTCDWKGIEIIKGTVEKNITKFFLKNI